MSIVMEVNKKLELIEILLLLADRQEKTAQKLENKYYTAKITGYFKEYLTHDAAIMTQKLIDEQNFIHIPPIQAILSLDSIRNNPEHTLHDWAAAVSDFITDTNFDCFWMENQPYYDMVCERVQAYDIDGCVEFAGSYFREDSVAAMHLLICPFAGNYGFHLNGTPYVVRCMPFDGNGNIEQWFADNLIRGIAHEYAHCFVNPVVYKYKEELDLHRAFFQGHKALPSAYNVNYAVMNEYFVRAYVRRYFEICNMPLEADAVEKEDEMFPHIEIFTDGLKEYEKGMQTFEQFYASFLHDSFSMLHW